MESRFKSLEMLRAQADSYLYKPDNFGHGSESLQIELIAEIDDFFLKLKQSSVSPDSPEWPNLLKNFSRLMTDFKDGYAQHLRQINKEGDQSLDFFEANNREYARLKPEIDEFKNRWKAAIVDVIKIEASQMGIEYDSLLYSDEDYRGLQRAPLVPLSTLSEIPFAGGDGIKDRFARAYGKNDSGVKILGVGREGAVFNLDDRGSSCAVKVFYDKNISSSGGDIISAADTDVNYYFLRELWSLRQAEGVPNAQQLKFFSMSDHVLVTECLSADPEPKVLSEECLQAFFHTIHELTSRKIFLDVAANKNFLYDAVTDRLNAIDLVRNPLSDDDASEESGVGSLTKQELFVCENYYAAFRSLQKRRTPDEHKRMLTLQKEYLRNLGGDVLANYEEYLNDLKK